MADTQTFTFDALVTIAVEADDFPDYAEQAAAAVCTAIAELESVVAVEGPRDLRSA